MRVNGGRKFLFVSHDASGGDLAWQVKKEGNDVRMFIRDPECLEVFDGFFDKSTNLERDVENADIIVIDDTGFGEMAESLRQRGKCVVGGSIYTDRLEEDRAFGQAEMERLGMPTLSSRVFDDYDDALLFLKEHPGRYVYKPCGYTSYRSKGLLFIARKEDSSDLARILSLSRTHLSSRVAQFQLQEFVSGIEVGARTIRKFSRRLTPLGNSSEAARRAEGDNGSCRSVVPSARR